MALVLVVNPVQVAKAVDSGYANHPDHKGAAEFVAHLHPGPHDIIIAEDVLQQTYYLGHVDYWLVNKQVAASYLHRVQGRLARFLYRHATARNRIGARASGRNAQPWRHLRDR